MRKRNWVRTEAFIVWRMTVTYKGRGCCSRPVGEQGPIHFLTIPPCPHDPTWALPVARFQTNLRSLLNTPKVLIHIVHLWIWLTHFTSLSLTSDSSKFHENQPQKQNRTKNKWRILFYDFRWFCFIQTQLVLSWPNSRSGVCKNLLCSVLMHWIGPLLKGWRAC